MHCTKRLRNPMPATTPRPPMRARTPNPHTGPGEKHAATSQSGAEPRSPTAIGGQKISVMRTIAVTVGGVAFLMLVAFGFAGTRGAWSATTDNGSNAFAAAVDFTPDIRVTTYQLTLASSTFTGTNYTLTLDQTLESNYFVMLEGAAGDGTRNTNVGPNSNSVRVTGDPFGNFSTTTGGSALRLSRRGSTGTWQGQITVVECLADCTTQGFSLIDVVEPSLNGGGTSTTVTTGSNFGTLGRVVPYGGVRGGGSNTNRSATADHPNIWARFWPSGTNTINVQRCTTCGSASLGGTSRWTVYVVEWGSDWSVQRATVTGSNGGDGVNTTGEYSTAPISSVTREHTWVWGTGYTNNNKLSSGFEGTTFTLGDGVSQNSTETLVAAANEATVAKTVDIYVLSHPQLHVTYMFGADNTVSGIQRNSISGTRTISAGACAGESYGGNSTGDCRFSLIANTSNGNGTAFPRPIVWSRITASDTFTWVRSRSGQQGVYWAEIVDFGDVRFS